MTRASLIILATLAFLMGLAEHSAATGEVGSTGIAAVSETTTTMATEEGRDPAFEEFQRRFRTKYFNIGVFFRTIFDFQSERTDMSTNGFEVNRARMTLAGEFDKGYGYLLQADFQTTPVIADARGLIRLFGSRFADVGQFKAPFSREFLRSSADRDFIIVPRVVDQLAPKRQLGLQFRGSVIPNLCNYAAGIFNGNGKEFENDNDEFLYVGRFEYSGSPIGLLPDGLFREEATENEFNCGVNVAYSNDSDVEIGDLIERFGGKRFLVGSDLQANRGKIYGAAEFIYSDLQPREGNSHNPYGYHFTVGYSLSRQMQLFARYDVFNADDLGEDSDAVYLGFSHRPTAYTRTQINFSLPTDLTETGKYRIQLASQLKF